MILSSEVQPSKVVNLPLRSNPQFDEVCVSLFHQFRWRLQWWMIRTFNAFIASPSISHFRSITGKAIVPLDMSPERPSWIVIFPCISRCCSTLVAILQEAMIGHGRYNLHFTHVGICGVITRKCNKCFRCLDGFFLQSKCNISDIYAKRISRCNGQA